MKKLNKKLSIFSLLIAMAIALMAAVLLINPATAYANSEFSAQNVEKVAMVNGASLRLNSIDDAHRGIRFEGYVNETWYEENGAQAGMLLYKGETAEQLTVDTEGVAKVNSVTWNDAASKQVAGLKYYSVVISEVPAEFNATTVTARAFVMDKEGNFYYADNQPARSMQKVASAAIQDGILDEIDGASSILDAYVDKANTNYYDFEDGVVPYGVFTGSTLSIIDVMTTTVEEKDGDNALKVVVDNPTLLDSKKSVNDGALKINLTPEQVASINPQSTVIRFSVMIDSSKNNGDLVAKKGGYNLRSYSAATASVPANYNVYANKVATDTWLTYEIKSEVGLAGIKANGFIQFAVETIGDADLNANNSLDISYAYYIDDVEIVNCVKQEAVVNFDGQSLNRTAFSGGVTANNIFIYENSANSAFTMNGKSVVPNMNKKLHETIGKDDLHLLDLSSWGASIPALANKGGNALFVETYNSDATSSHLTNSWIEILLPDSVKNQINPKTDSVRLSIYVHTAGSSSVNLRAVAPNSLTASPYTAGAGTTGEWIFYQNGLNKNAWNTYTSTFGEAAMTNLKTAGRLMLNLENMKGYSFFIDDIEIVRDTDGDGSYDTVAATELTVEDAVKESIGATSKLDKFEIYNAAGENVTATVMDENGYLKVAGNYVVKAYYTDASGITKIFNTKIRL